MLFHYITGWSAEKQQGTAFADVDVQLKQRHDLIPQLVDSVKGYMGHERESLLILQRLAQTQ